MATVSSGSIGCGWSDIVNLTAVTIVALVSADSAPGNSRRTINTTLTPAYNQKHFIQNNLELLAGVKSSILTRAYSRAWLTLEVLRTTETDQ